MASTTLRAAVLFAILAHAAGAAASPLYCPTRYNRHVITGRHHQAPRTAAGLFLRCFAAALHSMLPLPIYAAFFPYERLNHALP